MRNLLNPKWIFLINTLPTLILIFLFWGEFNIIKSLLKEENLRLWKSFGLALSALTILNIFYSLFLINKNKQVQLFYGFLVLLTYIPYLYFYGNNAEKIIPDSIPQWMVPGNMILYVGTFLMPALVYALLIIVTHFTPENKEQKAWKSFLIAIAIPISWYVFSQLILPFWKPVDSDFNMHALIIFIIIGTLVFLFFLIRAIFIIASKKANLWHKYQLAWKIPISIILPIFALEVNNGHLFKNLQFSGSGIFGDYSSYWFYILAIFNGILICLPNFENKYYRISLFIGRVITFAFTFYFFIVFLPFLPLSIIAVAAVGVGFLMLTPLLLFVIHVNELSGDFNFLKSFYSKKLLITFSILSFIILPAIITATYLKDRNVLNETLAYLYTPDYSKNYAIDKKSLSKTLDVIKYHKDDNRNEIYGSQIPYLSSYFNWLVLDNLTLSDRKINYIESVFFGEKLYLSGSENTKNTSVKISKISSKSTFNNSQNAWKSWVDLKITNEGDAWLSEYSITIDLPTGCWISDYYLFVGKKKEMGILAEKKSAMWVFNQIQNENRDPGILYYKTGNKVAFKVFPFAKNEVRKTGIEFIHKESLKLNIDDQIVELGNITEQPDLSLEKSNDKNCIYISSKEKSKLPKAQRTPYYYFIVDVSKGKEILKSEFINRMETLLNKNLIPKENAKICFANTYSNYISMDKNWKQKLYELNNSGGFYLERAIKKALCDAYKTNDKYYPIIITITDYFENSILENDFSDFEMAFPESDLMYDLTKNGKLIPHSLVTNSKKSLPDSSDLNPNYTVLAYPNTENPITYLPDNNEASIVLKNQLFETNVTDIKEKNWQSALAMHSQWTSQILHPEKSDKEWLNLVKYSFKSKIMTPVTSYLVVENEAQKAILKKKQQQVLSSNKSLDLEEDAQSMSEPGLILMLILLGLALLFKEKRKLLLKTVNY